jgi:phosphomannomutase
VLDAGLTSTPMVYWGTGKFNLDGSVMITASHNPAEYNGLKVSGKNVKPIGYQDGLSELETMIRNKKIEPKKNKGEIKEFDYRKAYLNFQKSYIKNFFNLNIAMDASNGMAGLFIRKLYGEQVHYIYEDLDGRFPNHEANPLVAKNVVDLQKLVKRKRADIGLIFDGDADRVMFVDENAQFISPDLMIALLGHYFLEDAPKNTRVLQDIRTSKAVSDYLSKYKVDMHTWRVGRAYAANKLREIKGLYGGELAGHYYFKDFYYSDSGILAASLILNIVAQLKREGVKLSEMIKKIQKYHNSGEINFKIDKKTEAMLAVKDYFYKLQKPDAIYDFDGYRLEYKDWWMNIRPSNTEPYLRFIAEAKTQKKLDEVVNTSTRIINSFAL